MAKMFGVEVHERKKNPRDRKWNATLVEPTPQIHSFQFIMRVKECQEISRGLKCNYLLSAWDLLRNFV